MAESVKTEQSVKTNFFEALKLLRLRNSKLMKVAYISEDHARIFSEFFNFSGVNKAQNRGQQKSVPVQKSKSSINFLLETLLGTTLQENKDTKELLQK
jgi:hypothetical protein